MAMLQEIKQQNTDLKTQITNLQKTTDSLSAALKLTNQNISSMDKKIDSIRNQLSSMVIQINSLSTQLNQANVNIADIQKRIAELQAKCQELVDLMKILTSGGSNLKNGQQFGGGIIAYLDSTGAHGLIISQNDMTGGPFPWRKANDTSKTAIGAFYADGMLNTELIIKVYGTNNTPTNTYAAFVAKNYTGGGFNDWYLPSYSEWEKINQTKNSGVNLNIGSDVQYITSSEDPWNYVGIQVLLYRSYLNGGTIGTGKDVVYQIRAIRKF